MLDAEEGRMKTWFADAILSGMEGDVVVSAARFFGLSERAMRVWMDRLVERGWFVEWGLPGDRCYRLGEKCEIVRTYHPHRRVDAGVVWEMFFQPFFALTPNVREIARFGFTEMLRHAFAHADAKAVTAQARLVDGVLTIAIVDDGAGIFGKVGESLDLPDKRMAVLELAKGCPVLGRGVLGGERVFLMAHLFDWFSVQADGLQFVRNAVSQDERVTGKVAFSAASVREGTAVMMGIENGSHRRLAEVMGRFAKGERALFFCRTIVPVKLASLGGEALASREQARRLMRRLEGFEEVVLDFSGVSRIGLSFADEIFRVFVCAYPFVRLGVVNALPAVERVIGQMRQ